MDRSEVEFLRQQKEPKGLMPTAMILGAYRRDLIGAGIGSELADDLVRDAAQGLADRHGLVVSNG